MIKSILKFILIIFGLVYLLKLMIEPAREYAKYKRIEDSVRFSIDTMITNKVIRHLKN